MPPTTIPMTTEARLPHDPELRKLASDVLDRLKFSFLVSAANPGATLPGRADAVFQRFLGTRSAQSRSLYRAKATKILALPPLERAITADLGRYSSVDPAQYLAGGSDKFGQLAEKLHVDVLTVDVSRLTDEIKRRAAQKMNHLRGKSVAEMVRRLQDAERGKQFKKLQLHLKKVKCLEETDEISASDEISMGGFAVDPDGDTRKIPQFVVSTDFDEGESVGYSGKGKLFAEWNLIDGTADNPWPLLYAAGVAMAEKDDGGFGQFLTDLWEVVCKEVEAAIVAGVAGVGAAIGAAIGGGIGAIVGGIGGIVGALVGLLIGWIISLFDNPDDVVAVKHLDLSLASALGSYYDWAGLTKSSPDTFTVDFNGDGGRYRTWFSYSVSS